MQIKKQETIRRETELPVSLKTSSILTRYFRLTWKDAIEADPQDHTMYQMRAKSFGYRIQSRVIMSGPNQDQGWIEQLNNKKNFIYYCTVIYQDS